MIAKFKVRVFPLADAELRAVLSAYWPFFKAPLTTAKLEKVTGVGPVQEAVDQDIQHRLPCAGGFVPDSRLQHLAPPPPVRERSKGGCEGDPQRQAEAAG
ncbi:MAG TPA: hypothetical protein VGG72_17990 [Bryobacteraceae bacterium]